MDLDRKMTALKELQGQMFRQGYESGELKGHVYPDVKPALDRWKRNDIKIYIYSSGSLLAQKLLFGFSEEGDMLPYFVKHYDTVFPGSKLESSSYVKIATEIFKETENLNILFLTDNVKEAEAANQVGIHTVVVCRDGEFKDDLRFPQVKTFDEIFAE
jgi:enolase-phosphatase E1